MKRITSGWLPNAKFCLTGRMAERALLAVFTKLYPHPSEYKSAKKFIPSSIVAEMLLISRLLQYCSHFRMYEVYCFCVLRLHEDMMRDKAWPESPLFFKGFWRDDTLAVLVSGVEGAVTLDLSVELKVCLFEVKLLDFVRSFASAQATTVVLAISVQLESPYFSPVEFSAEPVKLY